MLLSARRLSVDYKYYAGSLEQEPAPHIVLRKPHRGMQKRLSIPAGPLCALLPCPLRNIIIIPGLAGVEVPGRWQRISHIDTAKVKAKST